MTALLVLLGAACLLLALGFAIYALRTRHMLRQLDRMLDEAISGNFNPEQYNESQLSKLEAKLERFLSSSKLKRSQIESDQSTVHTLIGDISHQTKTPVANLLLYSQLLHEQENQTPETGELVAHLAANAEKLNFLIQALVKTSRLESGIIKIKNSTNSVAELVRAGISQVEPAALAKSIHIQYNEQLDVAARFDAKWCGEALFNILDNAIKYTPQGGQVSISVVPYEIFVRIDVADTGPGIPDAEITRVFSRFWRGAAAGRAEGVGIGLFLAREIVQACGGYIKASSTPNGGATFSIFLPSVKGKEVNLSVL